MADTFASSGNRATKFDSAYFTDWVRQNRFAKYFGSSENSVIHVKEDLTKEKGDRITFPLINRLGNSAVTGSNTLEGNEEAMDSRSHLLTVNQRRHAVRVSLMEEQKSAIGLRKAAKPQLMQWHMDDTKTRVIQALASVNQVWLDDATAAQRNTWVADNQDRVLFGAAKSNYNATYATALANVDSTSDKLSPSILGIAKRMAQQASPIVQPYMLNNDEEWYIFFADSAAFRDLKADSGYSAMLRDAAERGKTNPLFTSGDLMYDGIIIREIPEIGTTLSSTGKLLATAGASSIRVSAGFLCGAQALGVGIASRPETVIRDFDYGDKYGCAVRFIDGIEKLVYGTGTADTDDLKDHGVVTVYTSGVLDT
jgi:N4-gp56 family major capsid protein